LELEHFEHLACFWTRCCTEVEYVLSWLRLEEEGWKHRDQLLARAKTGSVAFLNILVQLCQRFVLPETSFGNFWFENEIMGVPGNELDQIIQVDWIVLNKRFNYVGWLELIDDGLKIVLDWTNPECNWQRVTETSPKDLEFCWIVDKILF
jgi:hypothetical protein